MEKATELLRDMNALFERAQRIVVDYLPPNSGISEHAALSELIGVLDGPEQRRVQEEVKELLRDSRSAFFSHSQQASGAGQAVCIPDIYETRES